MSSPSSFPWVVAVGIFGWITLFRRAVSTAATTGKPVVGGPDPNAPPLPTSGYQQTPEDLDRYLRANGIRYFSGQELSRPRHADVAARLGYAHFVPPVEWWPRLLVTARVADMLREAAGSPVKAYNAWRPSDYNVAVGGAAEGDHPSARAIDLSFADRASWARAVQRILQMYDVRDNLSIGVGTPPNQLVIHVGVDSARGHRRWRYTTSGDDVSWHNMDLA